MESELKKAVNLYEKGQLNSAKEIALHIYNSKPEYFCKLSKPVMMSTSAPFFSSEFFKLKIFPAP